MASSRKPSASLVVGLSGGVDSVVLLHKLRARPGVRALHVHHGLSPNADAWARFCARLCRDWRIPFTVKKVEVEKTGRGLEAAAREARHAAFRKFGTVALAHNLDDQAETVLMNLLRGAGSRGASGMQAEGRIGRTRVVRPLLGTTREQIVAYAKKHRLEWIEDESNANEALTRNFIRRSVGPLLEARFPQWKKSLARAAKLFARKENRAQEMLRTYLRARGMKAPSEAKLVEMLKQLSSRGTRTLIEHDGARLRVYRGRVVEENPAPLPARMEWKGEPELALPGGQLRFRRVKGRGIDPALAPLTVRARSGGERLQLDPKRPRRTLKNLFQEAGVPPWERERLPLLYRGDDLVWAPGLGIDVRFRAGPGRSGVLPEWKPRITP